MRRGAWLSLVAGAVLLAAGPWPVAAAPASPVGGRAPLPQQEGRRVERSDWVDHLPLAAGMALIVIAVDALFILKIVRDRRLERERRPAAPPPPTGSGGSGSPGPGRP